MVAKVFSWRYFYLVLVLLYQFNFPILGETKNEVAELETKFIRLAERTIAALDIPDASERTKQMELVIGDYEKLEKTVVDDLRSLTFEKYGGSFGPSYYLTYPAQFLERGGFINTEKDNPVLDSFRNPADIADIRVSLWTAIVNGGVYSRKNVAAARELYGRLVQIAFTRNAFWKSLSSAGYPIPQEFQSKQRSFWLRSLARAKLSRKLMHDTRTSEAFTPFWQLEKDRLLKEMRAFPLSADSPESVKKMWESLKTGLSNLQPRADLTAITNSTVQAAQLLGHPQPEVFKIDLDMKRYLNYAFNSPEFRVSQRFVFPPSDNGDSAVAYHLLEPKLIEALASQRAADVFGNSRDPVFFRFQSQERVAPTDSSQGLSEVELYFSKTGQDPVSLKFLAAHAQTESLAASAEWAEFGGTEMKKPENCRALIRLFSGG